MGDCPAASRGPPEDPSNQHFCAAVRYHPCKIKRAAFGRGRTQESTGHKEEGKEEAEALRTTCLSGTRRTGTGSLPEQATASIQPPHPAGEALPTPWAQGVLQQQQGIPWANVNKPRSLYPSVRF